VNTENSIFKNLNTNFNDANSVLINRIINSVKDKVETGLAVIYLGIKRNDPLSVYLFVITSNQEKRQGHELTSIIAETCKPFANVTALANNKSNVTSAVNGGNYFYSNVLLYCTSIFKDSDLQLPIPHPIEKNKFLERAERYWQHWYNQGKAYLQGAEHYLSNVLIALIRSILGYRLNVTNLTRMLKITEMFTDKVVSAFELDTPEGRRYYNLLYHANNDAHFSDDLKIEKDEVAFLLAKVKQVIEISDQLQ
jgi:hypothetical protein